MKTFIKNWLIPPKILNFILKCKRVLIQKLRYSNSDFQKNIELKDIHVGKRCFILGTGPSIQNQDLTLLKNEIVIGVSGLFNHKDIDVIQPNYYVLAPVFEYHKKYNKEESYINWLKSMDNKLSDDVVMIIHIGDKQYIEKYNIFSNKKIYWDQYTSWNGESIKKMNLSKIPDIYSVSETALFLAIYLGFEKIYLLGFDHNWFEGLHLYFDTDKYNKYFETTGKASVEKFGFDSEFQMIRHAKIFNKYKRLYSLKENIYNANANVDSYVDTFPKVKYEDLFKK